MELFQRFVPGPSAALDAGAVRQGETSLGPHRTIKDSMATKRHKGPPAGETGQEALYLKSLSDRQVPVAVKLRDGEVVSGWIEYFDDKMIRLTRQGKPNLFIYKTQIRTITEGGGPRASNVSIRSGRRSTSPGASLAEKDSGLST